MAQLDIVYGDSIGYRDDTVGTAYYVVIPGDPSYFVRLLAMEFDNGATPNGFYVMRPLAGATILNAQAASDTTLVLDRNPSPSGNTIANLDQVVYLASDGTYRKVQVSSWNGSTLTLTVGALPAAVDAESPMWNLGVYTDTDPTTTVAFPKIHTPASAVTPRSWTVGFSGGEAGAPILLYCPNATNQTKLNYAEYGYSNR